MPSVFLQGVMQGTIPYLGTFLTDLVMLDTAVKDHLDVSENYPRICLQMEHSMYVTNGFSVGKHGL